MRRLIEYFRQVLCRHTYHEVKDKVERIEDERSLGVRVYEYNRTRKVCSECNYVRNEVLAVTPNNI